jgi:hypothetical protein
MNKSLNDILKTGLKTVTALSSVKCAIDLSLEYNQDFFPVLDNGIW